MKTSARNFLEGQVAQIKKGAVNDEIELKLDGGTVITAIITSQSTEKLGLSVGGKAFALIKASSVIIADGVCGCKLSTRNQIKGKVSEVKPGAVNAEVVVDLGAGHSIVAIITNESCKSMGLQVGKEVCALFKASSVIMGTSA